MSKPKKEYPIITEQVYWEKVKKNEPYKGFVYYNSGTTAFVLPEVVVETKALSKNLNRFTHYRMMNKIRYIEESVPWELAKDAIRVDNQTDTRIRGKLMQDSINKGNAKIKFRTFVQQKLKELPLREMKILLGTHPADVKRVKNEFVWLKSEYERLLGQIEKDYVYTYSIPREILTAKETVEYRKHWKTETLKTDHGHFKTDKECMDEEIAARKQVDPFGVGMAQQPVIQAIAVGGLAVTAPILVTEAGLVSTEMWALKGGVSAVSQAIVNGPKEINATAVIGDAILIPGVDAIASNFIEYRPFSEEDTWRIAGYNKNVKEYLVEVGFSYYFGKQNSALGRFLPFNKFCKNYKAEYYILSTSINFSHSYSTFFFPNAVNRQNNEHK